MGETHPYLVPSRFRALEIEEDACNGCNRCVEVCPMDVLAPNPEKGRPPVVAYPEECWFCGCCVDRCPLEGRKAIRVIIPLPMKVSVRRGATKPATTSR